MSTSRTPDRSGGTRHWSIRTRLIVTLALVVSAAILLTTVISTFLVGRFLEDRVVGRLGSTAERVQATLIGLHGLTIELDTISEMARAEATTVVLEDGGPAPMWVHGSAALVEELLVLDLGPSRPAAVPGRPGWFAVSVDTRDLGLVVRDGGRLLRPTSIILATDASQQLATVRTMVLANTAAVVLAIGALVIVTVVIVSRGLRPLRTMSELAQAFADGDRSVRLPVPPDEPDIARLATSINGAFDAQARADDRLRSFVADASHELRTPLTTASGWIELYFQGGLDDPARRDEALERVRTQLGRMRVLTDELTLLARLDRERDLATDLIDLTQLAAEVVDDARVMNPDRSFTLSASGPALLLGDGPKLQQVLGNLLSNAVQHTPAGTSVEVTVVPAAHPDQAEARHVLLVTDHGPGIAPRDQPHIFERFWRSDASRTRHTGGSGLGLSIVSSIVDAHDGTSGVTSTSGRGATFRISLPAVAATGPALPTSPRSAQGDQPSRRSAAVRVPSS